MPERLHEAGRVAGGARLREGAERELADLDRDVLRLRLLLGEADGGDLGRAVRARGDGVVAHALGVDAGDLLGDEHTLRGRDVREATADHVADRPQPVAALVVGVDLEPALLELDAVRLEPEVLGVRGDADGHEQDLGLEGPPHRRPWLRRHHDLVAGDLGRGQLVVDERLDAALVERAGQLLRDLGILVRHEPGQELDDRHLGAERSIERGELDIAPAPARLRFGCFGVVRRRHSMYCCRFDAYSGARAGRDMTCFADGAGATGTI
jgi:hypothetical protein